jgi:hypothetical protein
MWKDSNGHPIVVYHESSTNMIKAMVHLFKDVYIGRKDKSGDSYDHRVPIVWEGKDVSLRGKQGKNRENRSIKEILPAMSLMMPIPPQPYVDSGVMTDPQLQHCVQVCPDTALSMYNGTPMRFSFRLTIRSEKQHELFSIYENIITRLARPISFLHILETDLQIKRDVPLTINNVDWGEVSWEFDSGDNSRPWEIFIDFETSAYFYPPIIEQGVIKSIVIDYKNLCADDPENTSFVVNTWTVDPISAGKEDPHEQVLTQTLFDDDYEIRRISVNDSESLEE